MEHIKLLENRIDELKQRIEQITTYDIRPLEQEIWSLYQNRRSHILDNKLYRPLSDLARYNDCHISSIVLVTSSGYIGIGSGRILKIENNHFLFQDEYESIYYDYQDHCYHRRYNNTENDVIEILGFFDLEIK